MKRKLKRAGMIAGVLAVAALMFFFPRPIVPDIEDTRVISVYYIQLEIGILTNDDTHQTITLGNIHNDIAESYGAWKQGVYNADALREELLDILELPE